MNSADVGTSIRPNLDLSQSTDVKVRAARRMSNDGLTWDTPVAIGTLEVISHGAGYGSSYADLKSTLTGKRLVQLGVEVGNNTGTVLEMGRVSVQLEVQP